MKFDSRLTFEDHVRGIVSRVFQRIVTLRLVKRVFVDTSVLLCCYYAFVLPILEYCSPVWRSAARCYLQLLERQVYSVARLFPEQTFLSLCHYVMLLHCVCYTKLIRTRIIACLVSFHLLLSEFGILELRLQLIH